MCIAVLNLPNLLIINSIRKRPDFIMLYRNGPAEVLRYMNITITNYVKNSKARVSETSDLVFSLVLITGAVYLMCIAVLNCPI
mmetsp:Transcript_20486/g.38358  ORF Transcript_20486/g.38358 Transcript_20486/m.38358 type:complete len:83 (-) Transcript_20486:168-416(-)